MRCYFRARRPSTLTTLHARRAVGSARAFAVVYVRIRVRRRRTRYLLGLLLRRLASGFRYHDALNGGWRTARGCRANARPRGLARLFLHPLAREVSRRAALSGRNTARVRGASARLPCLPSLFLQRSARNVRNWAAVNSGRTAAAAGPLPDRVVRRACSCSDLPSMFATGLL